MEDAMSDLAPEDRDLLDLARGGHEPTCEDRLRVRGALLARVGAGAGLVGTTAATSKAATIAVLWTKVLATVVVGTAVGGAGVVSYRATRPPRDQPAIAWNAHPRAGMVARRPGVEPPASTERAVLRPLELEESSGGRAPDSTVATPRPAAAKEPTSLAGALQASGREPDPPRAMPPTLPLEAAPVSVAATTPSPAVLDVPSPTPALRSALAPTTLEAETRLVRAGVGALHAGDSVHALALFDEHARLYPTGALAEERAAERVIALGDLRRCDDARAAALAFLRDHPSSPLAARVRTACASTPIP
jgi:hypothetical protein